MPPRSRGEHPIAILGGRELGCSTLLLLLLHAALRTAEGDTISTGYCSVVVHVESLVNNRELSSRCSQVAVIASDVYQRVFECGPSAGEIRTVIRSDHLYVVRVTDTFSIDVGSDQMDTLCLLIRRPSWSSCAVHKITLATMSVGGMSCTSWSPP